MAKRKTIVSPAQLETLKQQLDDFENRNNRLMERTAQTVLPLVGYINAKIEDMADRLDQNTPFSMKLRNRGNQAIRACEDFIKTFENLIIDGRKDGYVAMTDILFPCLDSWFDSIIKGKDVNPSLEVKRRAKLRYHDPYMAHVKECQDSFEDGYEKGYCDCVADVTKELAKMVEQEVDTARVVIDNGKVNIEPVTMKENETQTH